MNDIKLSGKIIKEPKITEREKDGIKLKFAEFILSVYRGTRVNKETQKKEQIRDLFICKCSGKCAESIEAYFGKGFKCLISDASIFTDRYIPEEHKNKSSKEIEEKKLYKYITYVKVRKVEYMSEKNKIEPNESTKPKNMEEAVKDEEKEFIDVVLDGVDDEDTIWN